MSEQPDIYIIQLPDLCADCGQVLAHDVAENSQKDFIARICPHHGVLAVAFLGKVEDKPAVISWALHGPRLSEKQCLSILADFAEQLKAEAEVLTSERVH